MRQDYTPGERAAGYAREGFEPIDTGGSKWTRLRHVATGAIVTRLSPLGAKRVKWECPEHGLRDTLGRISRALAEKAARS